MSTSLRRLATAGLALALAAGGLALGPPPAQAGGDLTAPGGVTVTRDAGHVNDFTVAWSAPGSGAADHYDVTVFADGVRSVTTVAGGLRRVSVAGRTLQTIYQVRVGARDARGGGDDSAQVTLAPALPGAPVALAGAAGARGIDLRWSPPARLGHAPVDHYRVEVTELRTGRRSAAQETRGTTLALAALDPTRSYLAAVSAVTAEGTGLTGTAVIGGVVPTAPRGVTALRDADDRSQVVVSWDVPSYPGSSPVTGYEVAGSGLADADFRPVDALAARRTSVTLPLAPTAAGRYAVRAVNAEGHSVASTQVVVATVAASMTPTTAYPVSVTVVGHTLTAGFVGHVGAATDTQLVLRLLPGPGWDHREERVLENGIGSATLDDVPEGRYTFVVAAANPAARTETAVLSQQVVVNDTSAVVTATQASFATGIGLWRGVYPAGALPLVVATREVAFDGSASMAITAVRSSVGDNVAAGTNGQHGVPVAAGQQLVVSAQGLTTTRASRWNVGISWWDGQAHQLAVVRTPQTGGTVGRWDTSSATFTAPRNALLATAFVEVGDLLAGQTAYVDGISLRSVVIPPAPKARVLVPPTSCTRPAVVSTRAAPAAVVLGARAAHEVAVEVAVRTNGCDLHGAGLVATSPRGRHRTLPLVAGAPRGGVVGLTGDLTLAPGSLSDADAGWWTLAASTRWDGQPLASATRVAVLHSAALAVAAPATVKRGGKVTVRVALRHADWTEHELQGYAHQRVRLQFRPAGKSWTTVATLTTDGAGRDDAKLRPARDGCYRAVYAGNATTDDATSAADCVDVR